MSTRSGISSRYNTNSIPTSKLGSVIRRYQQGAPFRNLPLTLTAYACSQPLQSLFFSPHIEDSICRNSERPKMSNPGALMLVDFTLSHEGAPPADPQLLALHAVYLFQGVAPRSGAAGFLDKLERMPRKRASSPSTDCRFIYSEISCLLMSSSIGLCHALPLCLATFCDIYVCPIICHP